MRVSVFRFIFLVLLVAFLAIAVPAMAAGNKDVVAQREVRAVVAKAVFPLKPTRVDIALAGNYAVSTVADATIGGSVLLRKSSGSWQIIQQTGGAYRRSDLVKLGLSSEIASQLQPVI